MMRHRPTERKALIALLEQEWDDVGELAEGILDLLLDIKWHRGGWIIVHREQYADGRFSYHSWGPYDTENQARRDIGKRLTAVSEGARAMPLRVLNLDTRADGGQELW